MRNVPTELQEEVMWSPWDEVGLEYARLSRGRAAVRATGLVMRMPGLPAGFQYVADLGDSWTLRRITFNPLDRPGWGLSVETSGTWRTDGGDAVNALSGCLDLVLSVTPLTTSLILRRLDLSIDESAELSVAYVDAPELRLERREQRYIRTGARTYRLEEAQSDTEFEVDDETVVLDWPGRYRRVWSVDKEARRLEIDRQIARREALLLKRQSDTRGEPPNGP